MAIEPFGLRDLSQLEPLQPHGWAPITPSFKFYSDTNFCLPFKYTFNGKIIGVGTAILHQTSAWLAHIIVDVHFRGQGIGTKITRELMDVVQQSGCKTISLIASPLGEPVYKRLGFVKETNYLFFKHDPNTSVTRRQSIDYEEKFKDKLLGLDASISGENRSRLLQTHLESSRVVVEHGELTGFYLPSLGEGPIFANTVTAGNALLNEKIQEAPSRVVLPEENEYAISFLLKNGFTKFMTGSRMNAGDKLNNQLSKIYNRTGGNLG